MSRMLRRLAPTLLAALVLAPLAHAATREPVFGLRAVGNPTRGYFVYKLTPGSTTRGGVIVSNTGNAPGTVKLFTSDATTGNTTGTVYQTDRRPTRAGAWVKLGTTELALRPGQHRTVAFTVHAPKGAKPGQWVGGIVAESTHRVKSPASKRKARVQIRIRDLTIVAVQVNVPGRPVVAMSIGGVKTGGQRGFQQLITHVASNGNVLVKPTGTITVVGPHGTRPQTLPYRMDTFLPHTAIDYPLVLKRALGPGTYSVLVTLRVPPANGAHGTSISVRRPLVISKQNVQQVFTSATPQTPPPGVAPASSSGGGSSPSWLLVAAIVVAVIALLLLAWVLLRRRGGAAAVAAPAPADPARESTPADWTEPPGRPGDATPAPDTEPPAAAPAGPERARESCEHLWEVDYGRAQLGDDGVWRFPHRCRSCGQELLATDVGDANRHAVAHQRA